MQNWEADANGSELQTNIIIIQNNLAIKELNAQKRMNCSICELAYNKNRKPLVLSCGHTFCSDCLHLGDVTKCHNCGSSSKPVINFALYEQITKKNLSNIDKYIKVCLFGNMNVGKSSVLRRLVDDQFEYCTNPTIGIDFKYVDKQVDDKTYRFQIWDSAGQERYRSMSSHHLKGSDVILLVYDVSRTFDENGLTYWIGQIENYAKHNNIIVVGNKIDLITDSKIQQQKLSKQPRPALLNAQIKAIQSFGWDHIKASCLSRQNVNLIWQTLIAKSKISKGTTPEDKSKSVILTEQTFTKTTYKTKESPTHGNPRLRQSTRQPRQSRCC